MKNNSLKIELLSIFVDIQKEIENERREKATKKSSWFKFIFNREKEVGKVHNAFPNAINIYD